METLNLFTHLLFFIVRQAVQIQFIAECSRHCHNRTGSQRYTTSGLMIRHGGYVRPHRTGRIPERCSVLNGQPFHSVRIVTAPDLRTIRQHTGVKTSSPSCTAFHQHMGKCTRQPFQNAVQTEYITVKHFPLPFRRERVTVYVRQTTVHVPLDITDVMTFQETGQSFVHPAGNFLAGQIQYQLIAPHCRTTSRNR